jgi:hypothetical protein
MGAEDFAAARRDNALTGHAAVTIVMMTPSFVITRTNAGLERGNPCANVLGSGRGHEGSRPDHPILRHGVHLDLGTQSQASLAGGHGGTPGLFH